MASTKSTGSTATSKKGSTKSDRKLAVNRNAYECVTGAPKQMPMNRNAYETVTVEPVKGPISAGKGVVIQKAAVGSVKLVDDTSTLSRTRIRRLQRRMEGEKRDQRLTRNVAIGCSVLLGVILVVSIVLGIIYGVRPSDDAPEHPHFGTWPEATYGREICIKAYAPPGDEKNPKWRECVLVQPPSEKNGSCHTVTCVQRTYLLEKKGVNGIEQKNNPSSRVKYYYYAWTTETKDQLNLRLPTFCVPSYRGRLPGHVHVCVNERCTFHLSDEDKRPLYNSSSFGGNWVDNCDELNPCWQLDDDQMQYLQDSTFVLNRTACKSETGYKECPNSSFVGAVLWFQHLRCELHNNDQVGTHCDKRYPYKLWECRLCKSEYNTSHEIPKEVLGTFCPGGEAKELSNYGCVVQCRDGQETPLPNGTPCRIKPDARGDYCLFGHCNFVFKESLVENWNLTDIDDVETCKRKRNESFAQKKPRFVVTSETTEQPRIKKNERVMNAAH